MNHEGLGQNLMTVRHPLTRNKIGCRIFDEVSVVSLQQGATEPTHPPPRSFSILQEEQD
jgi:hypothetical protein